MTEWLQRRVTAHADLLAGHGNDWRSYLGSYKLEKSRCVWPCRLVLVI